jgi:hypothetical protein
VRLPAGALISHRVAFCNSRFLQQLLMIQRTTTGARKWPPRRRGGTDRLTGWGYFQTSLNHCAEWEHSPLASEGRECSAGFVPGTLVATTGRARSRGPEGIIIVLAEQLS